MLPTARRAVLYVVIPISTLVIFPRVLLCQSADQFLLLLKASIANFRAGTEGDTRFTYQILEHQQNFNEKGKKTGEITRLNEMLYLSGRPYVRLLAVNGKPLSGKAERAEQKRYDDAVAKGKGFSEKQRSEQQKGKFAEVNFRIGLLLTDYVDTATGEASVDGHDCVVVDATPKPGLATAPQRHATVWIDPRQKAIVKVAFDLLADQGDLKKGSSGWMLFRSVDGATVMTASHVDYRMAFGKHNEHIVRIVTDRSMTDFKRFGSTAVILPSSTPASQPDAQRPPG